MAYKAQTNDIESPEITDLLRKVQGQLDEGQPKAALDVIERSRLKADWVTNAIGVCLLRLGEGELARDVFRRLVGSGMALRPDAPLVFKTNYATALLVTGGISAGLDVMAELHGEEDETVRRLQSAIEQWKKGFSLWQKIKWYTGDIPDRPIPLDFALGSLQ
jgi:hypothetical protein